MTPEDSKTLQNLLQQEPRSAIVALAQQLYDKAKKDLAADGVATQREMAILNDARRVLQRERDQPSQE